MVSFYAQKRESENTFETNRPMIMFVYKETNFSSSDPGVSLPSGIVFVLQEFDDVFPKEVPRDCH